MLTGGHPELNVLKFHVAIQFDGVLSSFNEDYVKHTNLIVYSLNKETNKRYQTTFHCTKLVVDSYIYPKIFTSC